MDRRNDPFLQIGDLVTLVPMTGGRTMRGRVVEAPVRVDALPRAGSRLHGSRVWVVRGPDGPGTVAAFAARIQVPGPNALLELVDLAVLADESRRAAVRAAARCPVLLLRPGKVSSGTVSLDLSTAGCRVAVPPGEPLSPGQAVQVALDLDGGASVWADGQVVRIEEDGQVAALRFTRIGPADAERLVRGVLAVLAPPHEHR